MFPLEQVGREDKSSGLCLAAGQAGLLSFTVERCPGAPGPEWFRDAVLQSSVVTVPLALAVQGNHEHRDVVVGHLPFRCETIVLPLCAVYQHLGQL